MDIKPFLASIFSHWWALMSCAAFTFIGLWANHFRKDEQWIVKVTFVATVVMGAVASYLSWDEEYLRANNAQQALFDANQPKLEAQIGSTMVGRYGNGETGLVITAVVKNTGAPSVAPLAGVTIVLKNGRAVDAKLIFPTGKDLPLPALGMKNPLILRARDFYPQKATENPIPKGGEVYGWAAFVIPGLSEGDVATTSTTIIWKCTDINGKEITATKIGMPGTDFGPNFDPRTDERPLSK